MKMKNIFIVLLLLISNAYISYSQLTVSHVYPVMNSDSSVTLSHAQMRYYEHIAIMKDRLVDINKNDYNIKEKQLEQIELLGKEVVLLQKEQAITNEILGINQEKSTILTLSRDEYRVEIDRLNVELKRCVRKNKINGFILKVGLPAIAAGFMGYTLYNNAK